MKQILTFLLIFAVSFSSFATERSEIPAKSQAWEERSDRAEKWFFEDLPRHVGNDFKEAFWNPWHLLFLAGGSVATVGIHQADSQIQKDFASRPLGKAFDDVMNIGAHPLVLAGASLVTLSISELIDAKKVAITSGTMLEALTLTEIMALSLQFATQRTRPDGSKHSFPSGHTSGAFALASVAEIYYGPWVGVPSFALASLVGVVRLDSNKHFASDVMAGAILGTLMGLGTAKFHKKEFSNYFLVPKINEDSVEISLMRPF